LWSPVRGGEKETKKKNRPRNRCVLVGVLGVCGGNWGSSKTPPWGGKNPSSQKWGKAKKHHQVFVQNSSPPPPKRLSGTIKVITGCWGAPFCLVLGGLGLGVRFWFFVGWCVFNPGRSNRMGKGGKVKNPLANPRNSTRPTRPQPEGEPTPVSPPPWSFPKAPP